MPSLLGQCETKKEKSLTIWQDAAGTWGRLRSFCWLQGKGEQCAQFPDNPREKHQRCVPTLTGTDLHKTHV